MKTRSNAPHLYLVKESAAQEYTLRIAVLCEQDYDIIFPSNDYVERVPPGYPNVERKVNVAAVPSLSAKPERIVYKEYTFLKAQHEEELRVSIETYNSLARVTKDYALTIVYDSADETNMAANRELHPHVYLSNQGNSGCVEPFLGVILLNGNGQFMNNANQYNNLNDCTKTSNELILKHSQASGQPAIQWIDDASNPPKILLDTNKTDQYIVVASEDPSAAVKGKTKLFTKDSDDKGGF